jgi:hypothetical protein
MSVAVLFTVVVPTGNAEPLEGVLIMVETPQLSVAVTVNVTLLVHWPAAALTVMLAGQTMLGGWLSLTVTVKLQVLVLPWISVAVLLTVVVPTGKADPLAGLLTMLWIAQLSVAVTVKVTLLAHWPGAALTVMFAGQVILGFSVSLTVTVCAQVALLL